MSDTYQEVTDDPTFDGGQVDLGDSAEVGYDQPTLNFDEYRDYRVPVKVDGEEQWVPLAEAVSGYQRQADYTRKTQEVSRQAQQLQVAAAIQQALDNDPAGTIQALAGHYGLDLGRQQAPQTQPQADPWNWDETPQWGADPVDQRYAQIEQRLARFEQAEQMAQIERTLTSLQRTYGEAFNPQEVVARAVATGNSDLEAVFKLIDYDRRYAQAQAQQRDQQVTAAKRQQAQVVSGGGSGRQAAAAQTQELNTVADFWHAIKREQGIA